MKCLGIFLLDVHLQKGRPDTLPCASGATDSYEIFPKISMKYTVTCIPIARQRLCKHILVTHAHATIGHPLLGNGKELGCEKKTSLVI
jgi:hypothetical protein